jgi:hypothetical protein
VKRYTESEIIAFLEAIDQNLKKPAELIIIGGTAASLAYGFKNPTQDIDTANEVSESLKKAIASAVKKTGYNIPVSKAAVYDGPYHHEDRWIEFEPSRFKKLIVKVPDPVDLILMKSLRLEAHDLAAIKAIVTSQKISAELIVSRYIAEMSGAIKATSDLDFNIQALIEECYGDSAALVAKTTISNKRKSK